MRRLPPCLLVALPLGLGHEQHAAALALAPRAAEPLHEPHGRGDVVEADHEVDLADVEPLLRHLAG